MSSSDEFLVDNFIETLTMLQRHGVAVRVPARAEVREWTMDVAHRVRNWARNPGRYDQPAEIAFDGVGKLRRLRVVREEKP